MDNPSQTASPTPSTDKNRPLVWLVCTGLGVVSRGFEQYIGSLALHLAGVEDFRLQVISGRPWQQGNLKATHLGTPNRKSSMLRNRPDAFLWEQRFFLLGILPLLVRKKPALIYLGEYRLYCYLFKIRKLLGLSYALCLYTGGQAIAGAAVFDPSRDYLHHVTPVYLPHSTHLPANRQRVLPHFFTEDFIPDKELEATIREKAGSRNIVLSVGLLDTKIKQMHLLIYCLGMQPNQWFPVLLGEPTADTPALREMLTEYFGENGFIMDKVPHSGLSPYYRSADVFVSCSPRESFGLAMVEALYHGLPVVAYDFFESRWVLGNNATLVDVAKMDVLEAAIQQQVANDSPMARQVREDYVRNRFTWKYLAKDYVAFFTCMTCKENLV